MSYVRTLWKPGLFQTLPGTQAAQRTLSGRRTTSHAGFLVIRSAAEHKTWDTERDAELPVPAQA